MPLLNPPDILPEAMRFLLRAVWAAGDGVPADDLMALVSPEGLVEALDGDRTRAAAKFSTAGRLIVDCSLAALRTNNLVHQDTSGDRAVSLGPIVSERWPSWEHITAEEFASFVREVILPGATADLTDLAGENPTTGPDDLARALVALLALPNPLQSVRSFEPSGNVKCFREHQIRWLGEDQGSWIVRNVERYRALERWVPYLGFGRMDSTGGLIMDSRTALRSKVCEVVTEEVPIGVLLDRLGSAVSVTDRGEIGSMVLEHIEPERSDDQVTPGLALTLRLLAAEGTIALTLKSDAASYAFALADADPTRYSHASPSPKGR